MAEFSLEPWELSPASKAPLRDEAEVSFEMEWRGKVRQFGVRCCIVGLMGHLFIHDWESGENWISCRAQKPELLDGSGYRYGDHGERERFNDLEQLARDTLLGKDARVGRIFFSSDFGEKFRGALVFPTGEARWLTAGPKIDFQLSSSFDGWAMNSAESYEFLLNDWKDEDSDAHFSWRWRHLNPEERSRSIVVSTYDLDEIKNVMTWVLQTTRNPWQRWANWHWSISAQSNEVFLQVPWFAQTEPPERVVRWGTLLAQFVMPPLRQDLIDTHICVRQHLDHANPWRSETVLMESRSTEHERTEAMCNLRVWLRGKVPDEEAVHLLAL